ncbi:MAG: hypothetical protein JO266_11065 [Acidobacteria bacterium]|nr:hypothetical protein [Acidobacteriota bacterium]MBV9484218.1 hypothetical protein [Acidobacteriota bacterium]
MLASLSALAQDNYEIQVYASETVAPGDTMVELHSNFTARGQKMVVDGVLPSQHAEHETLEVTHGFSDWFETGFYVFTTIQPDGGWQWVGDHLRPRVRIPESWHWPIGISLSTEIGYVRRQFAPDTWTIELRPIVDRQMGPWYLAFNPALERSFHGASVNQGVGFSPAVKASYNFSKQIAGGLEYYGSTGPIFNPDTFKQQSHQFFPTLDLNVSPLWEINFGVGIGVTRSTDHLIIKTIIGRRFSWPGRKVRAKIPASAWVKSSR